MPMPSDLPLDVTIDEAVTYLEKFGWVRQESKNPKLILFGGYEDDEGNPITIGLPASLRYVDAPLKLKEAMAFLARLTGRTIDEAIAEMRAPTRDIVKIRVQFEGGDELPSVEGASVMLMQIKSLMAYSAHMEQLRREMEMLRPRDETATLPSYVRQYGAVGQSYIRRCKFGHTFRGSFGFSIESYLGEPNKPLLPNMALYAQTPFERKVLQRLTNGLSSAERAEKDKSVDTLLKSYEIGLNANMCSDLSDIFQETPVKSIDYKVLWSPDYAPDASFFAQVKLTRKCIQYLKSAAELLKTKDDPKEITVKGEILRLEQSVPDEEGVERITSVIGRRVTISAFVNGRKRRISAYLDDMQHRLVCDAYKDRRFIELTGTLEISELGTAQLRFPRDLIVGDLIPEETL